LVSAENVTPEQAVTRILSEAAERQGKSPAEEMWGAFSSDEDVAMLDEIVAEAYKLRMASQPRDFGV